MDLFIGEIISYRIARRAQFDLVLGMLKDALSELKPHEKPILHSHQGWQYQMYSYQKIL